MRRVDGKDVDQRCHGVEGQSLQPCCQSISVFYLSFVRFYFITRSATIEHSPSTQPQSEGYWCNPHVGSHVPEKLIKQRTGQYSLEVLRSYECTSITQQRAVSVALASSEDTEYQSEVSNKGQIL